MHKVRKDEDAQNGEVKLVKTHRATDTYVKLAQKTNKQQAHKLSQQRRIGKGRMNRARVRKDMSDKRQVCIKQKGLRQLTKDA